MIVNNYGNIILDNQAYTGTGCGNFYNFGNISFGSDYSNQPNPEFECSAGGFFLMPSSILTIRIRDAPGGYDKISTFADQMVFVDCPICQYGGTLSIEFITDTYTPQAGDSYPIFLLGGSGNPCYGTFSSIVSTNLPDGVSMGLVYTVPQDNGYLALIINICDPSNTTCTQTSLNTYTQPTNTVITHSNGTATGTSGGSSGSSGSGGGVKTTEKSSAYVLIFSVLLMIIVLLV